MIGSCLGHICHPKTSFSHWPSSASLSTLAITFSNLRARLSNWDYTSTPTAYIASDGRLHTTSAAASRPCPSGNASRFSTHCRLCNLAGLGFRVDHLYSHSPVCPRDSYWLRWLNRRGLLAQPRLLQQPTGSIILYSDATPSSIAGLDIGPPRAHYSFHFQGHRPTAFAKMASALHTLNWAGTTRIPQHSPCVPIHRLHIIVCVLASVVPYAKIRCCNSSM